MTLKDKLMIYISRKYSELEADKANLNSIRFRGSFDSLDIYELMRSDIRIQCWSEFIDELFSIVLNIK